MSKSVKKLEQSKSLLPAPRQSKAANSSLQKIADNSPQVRQLKTCQNIANQQKILQRRTNQAGLPNQLKSGIETLSGISMDDVKVHYNSSKPSQLQAHAYAQGNQIHVAAGQDKHLPHEAWHVVQQKQGRVKPTMNMSGVSINDDKGLEKEADIMGAKALQQHPDTHLKK